MNKLIQICLSMLLNDNVLDFSDDLIDMTDAPVDVLAVSAVITTIV